jgi:hypothetical protein
MVLLDVFRVNDIRLYKFLDGLILKVETLFFEVFR